LQVVLGRVESGQSADGFGWIGSQKMDPWTTLRYASAVYAVVMCLSVCLSVCLSQVGVLSKRLDESSWFLTGRLLFTYPTLCFREFMYFQKYGVLSLEPCAKLWTLKISPQQVDRVVELVDDAYTTVDESWLFTTS